MLANIESAEYVSDINDPQYGSIRLLMNNTTVNGYRNLVLQYQDPNTFSMPNDDMLVDLDVQSATQMQVTGFNTRLKDSNYSIQAGEWSAFNQNWYLSTRINGVEIQQAQTPNKENMMMGQSTNSVLNDILNYLIQLTTYLSTHTHDGVTPGPGVSGNPSAPPPVTTDIADDEIYIAANKNLSITGTYEPK